MPDLRKPSQSQSVPAQLTGSTLHRWLTGHTGVNIAQGRYMAAPRPEVKPATS